MHRWGRVVDAVRADRNRQRSEHARPDTVDTGRRSAGHTDSGISRGRQRRQRSVEGSRWGAQVPADPKVADALKGVRDYEVTYDKTKTRAELTPKELKDLGVTYAGDESTVAKRTKALASLDILKTLGNKYQAVTDKFGAKTDKDFAPDDPNNTFNYFQPRSDPLRFRVRFPMSFVRS